jgi:hypothetical protein
MLSRVSVVTRAVSNAYRLRKGGTGQGVIVVAAVNRCRDRPPRHDHRHYSVYDGVQEGNSVIVGYFFWCLVFIMVNCVDIRCRAAKSVRGNSSNDAHSVEQSARGTSTAAHRSCQ